MALIGAMIAQAFKGNPSLINYDMFVAVFGMLTLFYLIAAAWSDSFQGHPALPLALDALNVLFFFIAAVAMAAELGAHSCSNSVSSTSEIDQLSTNPSVRHTPTTTTSQTEPTTHQSAVAKPRPQQPSCGSHSPALLPAWSSPSSTPAAVEST